MTILPHVLRYTCPLLLRWGLEISRSSHVWFGDHCLHLYYNCPRKDSGTQSYSHLNKRKWSWLPAYKPSASGYYSIQTYSQDTIHTRAIWRGCDAQWAVDLRGRRCRAWHWLVVSSQGRGGWMKRHLYCVFCFVLLTRYLGTRYSPGVSSCQQTSVPVTGVLVLGLLFRHIASNPITYVLFMYRLLDWD